jgi:hypothetical protein
MACSSLAAQPGRRPWPGLDDDQSAPCATPIQPRVFYCGIVRPIGALGHSGDPEKPPSESPFSAEDRSNSEANITQAIEISVYYFDLGKENC